ncbi:MAG TPA: CoB--CoM heterodisulfide reductase iron-sulfur subunit A family protein [Spirochaetes bacterium]|nr:CoB--CoM heterodisulfide reductase iron-sulfur subunit A family protein [Spirochaetota bacterium]
MTEIKTKNVLVIGAGIAGMQSALLLAEKNHRVSVLDNAPAIGGFFPLLDRTFPTNSCGVCFLSPKPPAYCPIYESDYNENIELLTSCEIKSLKGSAGNFKVSYIQKPKYIASDKCTLCGKCAEVCPAETQSELGGGIEKRKAVYMPFPQAIPRSYTIDDSVCTKCGECLKVCGPGAIYLGDIEKEKKLRAGAIVLGFGFEPFQAERRGEYGIGRYKNVVSSVQYERMLSYSAATGGLPKRFSDGKIPKKVAMIQCVGSRDVSCGQGYCSSICCMYAAKQAMISKDRNNDLDIAIFYMDVRTMGKDYERYYERAKNEYGIRYVRSSVSCVREMQRNKDLKITYADESGNLKEENFDMVVLSTGFTPPRGIKETAKKLSVELNEYNFCGTEEFSPTRTNVPGIFVAGAFSKPMDIPETVVEASGAAADVSEFLGGVEHGNPEGIKPVSDNTDDAVNDEALRIGVFICDKKNTLSEKLDIDDITRDFTDDLDVTAVHRIDVTSLDEGVARIVNEISEKKLNRVLAAGYRCVALKRVLKDRSEAVSSGACRIYVAGIGEQCADVHDTGSKAALSKAKSMIRAGLCRAKQAAPGKDDRRKLDSRVLVVGGGVAGLTSCMSLAGQGMDVTLVEKDGNLGSRDISYRYTAKGSDVQALVRKMVTEVESNPSIEVLRNTRLTAMEGNWGRFRSKVSLGNGDSKEIEHGAVIFATGGSEAVPDDYQYGKHENIITQNLFEQMIFEEDKKALIAGTIVMIQCVGSRDEKHPYCSRVCCLNAVKNSLIIKKMNPDVDVFVLYRDIRTYGFFEKLYFDARNKGVIFINYEQDEKPWVSVENGVIKVSCEDKVAAERVTLKADLLVLSSGIVPDEDNVRLAEVAKLDINDDGFFNGVNAKSAPLDSIDRGKYFAGLCHSPNLIEDVISQGKAAAARASALLYAGYEEYPEHQAYVNERRCSGCGLCVTACPYDARVLDDVSVKAAVLPDLCHGCGTCVISCPNGASQQYGFERSTMFEVLNEVMG